MKEQWKKLDSDAKLLVNVEEGRTVPVKIELPISAFAPTKDDYCKKILTTLRVLVLLALLVLLSWTSMIYYTKIYYQTTTEFDKPELPNNEALFSSEENKKVFRNKVYESKEVIDNSASNEATFATQPVVQTAENRPFLQQPSQYHPILQQPPQYQTIPRQPVQYPFVPQQPVEYPSVSLRPVEYPIIPTHPVEYPMDPQPHVQMPLHHGVFPAHFLDASMPFSSVDAEVTAVENEDQKMEEFMKSVKNDLAKLTEQWRDVSDRLKQIGPSTEESKDTPSDEMSNDIKEETPSSIFEKPTEQEAFELLLINQLMQSIMRMDNDALQNIDDSNEDNVISHRTFENIPALTEESKTSDERLESFIDDFVRAIGFAEQTSNEDNEGPIVNQDLPYKINNNSEEKLTDSNDDKSENPKTSTDEYQLFGETAEKPIGYVDKWHLEEDEGFEEEENVSSIKEDKNSEEKLENLTHESTTPFEGNYEDFAEDTFFLDDKSREMIKDYEASTTTSAPVRRIERTDIPTLVARRLESVVGENNELLSWYYENKNLPNFEDTNDKLKLYAAKFLFNTNIEESETDTTNILDLIIDDKYYDDFGKLLDPAEPKPLPETEIQNYIVHRLLTKMDMIKIMENGWANAADVSGMLEDINKSELRRLEQTFQKSTAESKEKNDKSALEFENKIEPVVSKSFIEAMKKVATMDSNEHINAIAINSHEDKSQESEVEYPIKGTGESYEEDLEQFSQKSVVEPEDNDERSTSEGKSENESITPESVIEAMRTIAAINENEQKKETVVDDIRRDKSVESEDQAHKEYEQFIKAIEADDTAEEESKDMNDYLSIYGDGDDY